MARPEKFRIIKSPPLFNHFKPAVIPMNRLDRIDLTIAEYEAIRLADYQNLDHVDAAKLMEISRPTFTRLIEKARQKIAALIIEGKALIIEGGNVHFNENLIKCMDCGHLFKLNINQDSKKCEKCSSENISDLAFEFGHGRCCRNRGRKGGGKDW